MYITRRNFCKGCSSLYACAFSPVYNYVRCPCAICIVKSICESECYRIVTYLESMKVMHPGYRIFLKEFKEKCKEDSHARKSQ